MHLYSEKILSLDEIRMQSGYDCNLKSLILSYYTLAVAAFAGVRVEADPAKNFQRKILLYISNDQSDQSHDLFLGNVICQFQCKVKFYADISL